MIIEYTLGALLAIVLLNVIIVCIREVAFGLIQNMNDERVAYARFVVMLVLIALVAYGLSSVGPTTGCARYMADVGGMC